MFERFTQEARHTVLGAQEEARRLRAGRVGTEHLLLALLDEYSTVTAALAERGLTRGLVAADIARLTDDLDADALAGLGIDLDAVRARAEAAFGPGAIDRPGPAPKGHIPFSPRAKKVLELSLREAVALRSKQITAVHLTLGLLREGEGLAAQVLGRQGVDLAELRRELSRRPAA